MKLNLGCGHNKFAGCVNVDAFQECNPDVVFNVEVTPWIWDDSSVDAVIFNHSLEHMGQQSSVFLGIMKELYRVCKNNAVIEINVPHPRHDNFISDPTHVRIITPALFALFDKKNNDEWKLKGFPNSPFAHYLGVDFVTTDVEVVIADPYSQMFSDGKISGEELEIMAREKNNILSEYRIKLSVRKPENQV